MTMLQGRPKTPHQADDAIPRRHARCPECGDAYRASHPNKIFCGPRCRDAHHNRDTVRGRVLVPLVMAARLTRGGSRGDVDTGRRARRDAEQLIDRWIAEDRAAGRLPATDYVRIRIRKGFESL